MKEKLTVIDAAAILCAAFTVTLQELGLKEKYTINSVLKHCGD
jgi:hypothetical protein